MKYTRPTAAAIFMPMALTNGNKPANAKNLAGLAIIVLWTYTVAALLVAAFVVPERRRARGRASPADLQRFLF